MPDPLTIAFAVEGADMVSAAFSHFARMADGAAAQARDLTHTLNAAADAYRTLNAEAERYKRVQGGLPTPAINIGRGNPRPGAGVTPAPGGAPAPSQPVVPPPRFTSGPFQRQEKLAEEMRRALAGGNGRAIADVSLAQGRNDKAIERALAGPKGVGDKLLDVFKSSRFAVSGGKAEILPLVGKSLGAITEALGPEVMALVGPVGVAATAAGAAAKALFDLTKASAEAGAAYARFTYAIGSNGPGAAGALAVGKMAGLDASGTAALAQGLNSAITGSAMGRMFGQRVGVFNQASPYGNVDVGSQLVKAVEGLRSIKSFDERVRTMNALGLQGAAAAVMMPQAQYDLHKQDAAATAGIMDPDFQQKSLAFQDSLGRVGDAFERLMVVIGKPMVAGLTNVMNNIADGINGFALVMNSPAIQQLIKGLESTFGIAGAVAGFAKPGDDPHMAEQRRTTDAIKEQTALMKTPGVYGKDTDGRLGRAMGSGVGFGADSRARHDLMRDGYAMGAF